MIGNVLIYLLIVNIATIAVYYQDKRSARFGNWRTKEKTLLGMAFFGGTPAAYWAINKFRHKSKKSSFKSKLFLIAILQFFTVIYLIFDKVVLGN